MSCRFVLPFAETGGECRLKRTGVFLSALSLACVNPAVDMFDSMLRNKGKFYMIKKCADCLSGIFAEI